MSYLFDAATALEPDGEGSWLARTHYDYMNNKSTAFGGWIAALFVKAVSGHSDFRGQIVSLSVMFMSAVSGPDVKIRVKALAAKARTDFWRAELHQISEDGEVLCAVADIVTGLSRDGAHDYQTDFVPPKRLPEDCFRMPANPLAPRWVPKYDWRLAEGLPFRGGDHPRSVSYIREDDLRPVDMVSLAAIMDTSLPRPFYMSDKPGLASTLSLSTYIYATAKEISDIGAEYLILEVDSAVIRGAKFDQRSTLRRRDGRVLATSYQTAVYR